MGIWIGPPGCVPSGSEPADVSRATMIADNGPSPW